jgi:hypothetical protein
MGWLRRAEGRRIVAEWWCDRSERGVCVCFNARFLSWETHSCSLSSEVCWDPSFALYGVLRGRSVWLRPFCLLLLFLHAWLPGHRHRPLARSRNSSLPRSQGHLLPYRSMVDVEVRAGLSS